MHPSVLQTSNATAATSNHRTLSFSWLVSTAHKNAHWSNMCDGSADEASRCEAGQVWKTHLLKCLPNVWAYEFGKGVSNLDLGISLSLKRKN